MGTPATWEAQLNMELGTLFPGRTATMFTQFETAVNFTPAAGGNASTYTYTMYPSVAPPTLYVNGTEENGGTFSPATALTMSATTGTIYYTTDGSDPRTGSTDFTVSSITLSGTTATVTLNNASTGLYNGEDDLHRRGLPNRVRRQFHHRQRDRQCHRRDDHLHLHGERLAHLARHARWHGRVDHRRHVRQRRGQRHGPGLYGGHHAHAGRADQCPRLFRKAPGAP